MWISFWFQIKGEKGLLNDLEKNTETLGFEEWLTELLTRQGVLAVDAGDGLYGHARANC